MLKKDSSTGYNVRVKEDYVYFTRRSQKGGFTVVNKFPRNQPEKSAKQMEEFCKQVAELIAARLEGRI